jgi:hypothetical protein
MNYWDDIQLKDKDGNIVRHSKNLSGLSHWINKQYQPMAVHAQKAFTEYGSLEETGILIVEFRGGYRCEVGFADYQIMLEWLSGRRLLRGLPFYRCGQPDGTIGRSL